MEALANRPKRISHIKFTDQLERSWIQRESRHPVAPDPAAMDAVFKWTLAVVTGLGSFSLLAWLAA